MTLRESNGRQVAIIRISGLAPEEWIARYSALFREAIAYPAFCRLSPILAQKCLETLAARKGQLL